MKTTLFLYFLWWGKALLPALRRPKSALLGAGESVEETRGATPDHIRVKNEVMLFPRGVAMIPVFIFCRKKKSRSRAGRRRSLLGGGVAPPLALCCGNKTIVRLKASTMQRPSPLWRRAVPSRSLTCRGCPCGRKCNRWRLSKVPPPFFFPARSWCVSERSF